MARCTGHCCRRFSLHFSPEILQSMAANEESSFQPEIKVIAEMVEYLGKSDIGSDGRRMSAAVHWYSCKNLDDKSGDCSIYETRPEMCRQFPYEQKCQFSGCTMTEEPNRNQHNVSLPVIRESNCNE